MLRDKNLIPLSHQHQRALALCVRIDRASPVGRADLDAWQAETVRLFQTEIRIHFVAEEQVLFPAAGKFQELAPLVEDLTAEHATLRKCFVQAEARQLSAADLSDFAQRMSAHIRKEERRLFERMQGLMTQDELTLLGRNLNEVLKDRNQACALPTEVTGLRPAN
jgi:iron-sulfur cluster repair protein YtfE (RIC family)